VNEPFRCTACGTMSPSATRCENCGAGSFELARAVARPDSPDPPSAELLSLQAARAERERRDQPKR